VRYGPRRRRVRNGPVHAPNRRRPDEAVARIGDCGVKKAAPLTHDASKMQPALSLRPEPLCVHLDGSLMPRSNPEGVYEHSGTM
jgi:hypothetical protein